MTQDPHFQGDILTRDVVPREEFSPLLADLAVLPVFFDLKGKRVILQGASDAAAWKCELLRAAGAQIDLYSSFPCGRLQQIAEQTPDLRLFRRKVCAGDFQAAVLAIAEAASPEDGLEFAGFAKQAGVITNIIDKPAQSDFQFGSLINRSPLIIGISTHGAAPILAQALRVRFEAFLPETLGGWLQAAKSWRAKVAELPGQAKRRFWDAFTERALAERSAPDEALLPELFNEFSRHATADPSLLAGKKGSVALVGAGPGDPELLTLKALRVLQSADILLYDDLVSPAIVDMARREAHKIPVGKRGYRPSCKQDYIVALMLAYAEAGKRVVRLKGGDPMIFGRANEEISALQQAGIPVEVVPGVTAALGAASSLKLSLTERDKARRLQFVTAHGRDGKLPEDIDWRSICDPRASTIVYMGVKTLGELSQRLLQHGMDPATPALLVEKATWADERVIPGTIASLPGKVAEASPEGPCILLIGAAFGTANDAAAADTKNPLFHELSP